MDNPPPLLANLSEDRFQLNDLSVVESCQYSFVYKSKSFNLTENILCFLKWANL